MELLVGTGTRPRPDPPCAKLHRADQTLPEAIEKLERNMVTEALASTDGRLERAAERLGISRSGLYLKRYKLGLDDSYFAAIS